MRSLPSVSLSAASRSVCLFVSSSRCCRLLSRHGDLCRTTPRTVAAVNIYGDSRSRICLKTVTVNVHGNGSWVCRKSVMANIRSKGRSRACLKTVTAERVTCRAVVLKVAGSAWVIRGWRVAWQRCVTLNTRSAQCSSLGGTCNSTVYIFRQTQTL